MSLFLSAYSLLFYYSLTVVAVVLVNIFKKKKKKLLLFLPIDSSIVAGCDTDGKACGSKCANQLFH